MSGDKVTVRTVGVAFSRPDELSESNWTLGVTGPDRSSSNPLRTAFETSPLFVVGVYVITTSPVPVALKVTVLFPRLLSSRLFVCITSRAVVEEETAPETVT